MMADLWLRLVAFGFRLLYNELAWLYDAVSWVVSGGLWRTWQRSTLGFLPPAGTVLEVGFGPGHLLVEMAQKGHIPIGLDLSPAMLRLARRRLRQHNLAVPLCRGRAEALPFAPHSFDALLLTFPPPFVYDPAWIKGAVRILKPGGRIVILEMAVLSNPKPLWRWLEWLYRITGQREPPVELCHLLDAAGLSAQRKTVPVQNTVIGLVLADKAAPRG